MTSTPPPLRKGFGLHDWAALLSLLILPLEQVAMMAVSLMAYMFPDVRAMHEIAVWVAPAVSHSFPYIGIALAVLALLGLRPENRARICLMAGIGMVAALYLILVSRFTVY